MSDVNSSPEHPDGLNANQQAAAAAEAKSGAVYDACLLYTSPSPRDS